MSVKKLSLTLLAVAPCLCAVPVLADPNTDARLSPGIYPIAPTQDIYEPASVTNAPVDLNWSVGLRASQISSNQGNSFTLRLRPEVSLDSLGTLADTSLAAYVEIARGETLTPTSAGFTGKMASQLGEQARLNGEASLKFNRDLVGTPGLDTQIIQPADVTTANVAVGYDQKLGRFNLGLRGSLDRVVYGATERRDTGTTDNTAQNHYKADGTVRLGYQATPIVEVYGEGQFGRYWFDQASPTTGLYADAYTRSLKAGISGNWRGVVTAHAALGVGQYLFTDGSRPEVTSRLYEAGLTVRPDETVGLTGLVSTTIEPTGADSTGTVRTVTKAELAATYQVNSTVGVRASAEIAHAEVEGNGEVEDRRGAGVGANYEISNRTKLSADYNYAHRTNSATGTFDSHQVSVGVTLAR